MNQLIALPSVASEPIATTARPGDRTRRHDGADPSFDEALAAAISMPADPRQDALAPVAGEEAGDAPDTIDDTPVVGEVTALAAPVVVRSSLGADAAAPAALPAVTATTLPPTGATGATGGTGGTGANGPSEIPPPVAAVPADVPATAAQQPAVGPGSPTSAGDVSPPPTTDPSGSGGTADESGLPIEPVGGTVEPSAADTGAGEPTGTTLETTAATTPGEATTSSAPTQLRTARGDGHAGDVADPLADRRDATEAVEAQATAAGHPSADDTTGAPDPAPSPEARGAPASAAPSPVSATPDRPAREPDALDQSPPVGVRPGRSDAEIPTPVRPPGAHRLALDLGGEGLGPLRVEAFSDSGTLHLNLSAGDKATRDALGAHLSELRHDLEAAGVQLGSLDVDDGQRGRSGDRADDLVDPDRPHPDRPSDRASVGNPVPVGTERLGARTRSGSLDLRL